MKKVKNIIHFWAVTTIKAGSTSFIPTTVLTMVATHKTRMVLIGLKAHFLMSIKISTQRNTILISP